MLQVWLRRWLVGVWLWYDRLRWQSLLHAFATWSAAAAITSGLAVAVASTAVAVSTAACATATSTAFASTIRTVSTANRCAVGPGTTVVTGD